jgi:hypothetical protein
MSRPAPSHDSQQRAAERMQRVPAKVAAEAATGMLDGQRQPRIRAEYELGPPNMALNALALIPDAPDMGDDASRYCSIRNPITHVPPLLMAAPSPSPSPLPSARP